MISNPFKIQIVGIGGVGGYYGGLLAHHFKSDSEVLVQFQARGKHLKSIRENGLSLNCHKGNFTIEPDLVSDTAHDFGISDLIIICVKSYHLEGIIESLRSNIGPNTTLLPLLNGVEATEQLRYHFPNSNILYGFVYVNSHQRGPGHIEQRGIDPLLNFGTDRHLELPVLEHLLYLFKAAGITAKYHKDIFPALWEKYILVASTASLTAYYGEGVQEVSKYEDLEKIIKEIYNLAIAKGVNIEENIIKKLLNKIETFKTGVKSSMQIDFERKRETELELFTGYVARMSNQFGLKAPITNKIYNALKERLEDTNAE